MAAFTRHFDPEVNVLQAGLERVRKLYNEYDNVLVCFSGGKDSLACLWLCKLVAIDEMGLPAVKVWFRDEEVIHQSVIDFVAGYRDLPWIDMQWWSTPLESHKSLLGIITDYIQWDPARDPARGGVGWVRGKPDWAVTNATLGLGEDVVMNQYSGDELALRDFKGSTCLITGIRAAESLLRYQALMGGGRRGPGYWLSWTKTAVNWGWPVADWSEDDIFRFFYDLAGEEAFGPQPDFGGYCAIYDAQLFSRLRMRVGTVLTSEAAPHLDKLRCSDPDLYDACVRIWPEMAVQARYIHDVVRTKGEVDELAATYESVEAWARANLEGRWLDNALYLIGKSRARPHLFPRRDMMQSFLTGGYKRRYMTSVDTAVATAWALEHPDEMAEARRYTEMMSRGRKR